MIGCRGKGTSSKPAKRAKIDHNLIDALDRLVDCSVEIERLQIEVDLTMYKENLADCQKNRKLELELFELQQESNECMADLFVDVVKIFF